MRRLPVYLLLDTSESMVGGAIEAVRAGLVAMLGALRKDPYALETCAISVITFGGKAQQIMPLTELYAFQPPSVQVQPGTTLGAGIDLLDQAIDREVVKTTPDQKGDYKPLVFILTDGQPTDDWRPACDRFKRKHKSVIIYAIGCGDDVDFSILRTLTENTYTMQQMDAAAFARLFVCISASIQSASGSIGMQGKQEGPINLEKTGDAVCKVETVEKPRSGKKRQIFIPASCSKTGKAYLMRYRLDEGSGKYNCVAAHPLDKPFSREESGALESVAASDLLDLLPCPHCGNPGCGRCECGSNICFGEENLKVVRKVLRKTAVFAIHCPVCGKEVLMSAEGDGGGDFDINQSVG